MSKRVKQRLKRNKNEQNWLKLTKIDWPCKLRVFLEVSVDNHSLAFVSPY